MSDTLLSNVKMFIPLKFFRCKYCSWGPISRLRREGHKLLKNIGVKLLDMCSFGEFGYMQFNYTLIGCRQIVGTFN